MKAYMYKKKVGLAGIIFELASGQTDFNVRLKELRLTYNLFEPSNLHLTDLRI